MLKVAVIVLVRLRMHHDGEINSAVIHALEQMFRGSFSLRPIRSPLVIGESRIIPARKTVQVRVNQSGPRWFRSVTRLTGKLSERTDPHRSRADELAAIERKVIPEGRMFHGQLRLRINQSCSAKYRQILFNQNRVETVSTWVI